MGTITVADGTYFLNNVPTDGTLVFSFIGMQQAEMPIQGRSVIPVQLQEAQVDIAEVVAIGYGTQRKSDLTGSVAVVNTREISKAATNDITKALQGQVAGVSIQGSGEPGASPKVKIRGIGSFGNNDPLYVIDGVFAPINDVPMSAIESIQILKDASAAAIYGSRAANGVVIITTNRGKQGEVRVNYSGYYGVQNIVNRYDVANREQYQMLVNEATQNALYFDPTLIVMPANNPLSSLYVNNIDTDWQDEAFKTGHITDHTVSISGGNTISNFHIGLNYFDQSAPVTGRGPSYTRYGVSVNSDHQLGKLKVGESIHYTYADQTLMTFLHDATMLLYTVNAIPTIPVYSAGTIDGFGSSSKTVHGSYTANVIGMNKMKESNTNRYRFIGNVYAEYELMKDLKFKTSLSYERTDWRDVHFDPVHDLGWFYVNNIAKMDDNRGFGYTSTIENTLHYHSDLGKLNMDVLLGQSALNTKISRTYGHAEGFTQPYFKVLSQGTANNYVKGDEYQSRLVSYFGRLMFNWDDKYLLTGTFRRDGSSRFSPQNRWGNFPSIAAAWKLHNEPFMSGITSVVNELKLRGSYGILGNQNIGDYLFQGYINPYAHYVFNGQLAEGASQYLPASPTVKWEKSITTNIGVDLGFLNNKLVVTADYYRRKVEDLLYGVPVPNHLGFYSWESPTINGMSLENKGIELSALYRGSIGDLSYSVGANVTTLKNKVLSLGYGNNPISGIMSRTEVGREVGEFYGWQVDGVFQNQAEIDLLNAGSSIGRYQEATTRPGDFRFKDINGRDANNKLTGKPDGKIDDDDRTYLGSAIPNLYFGFNVNLAYKRFDFTLAANGVSGNMINNSIKRSIEGGAGWDNYATSLLDRWTPENPNTGRPRVVMYDPNKNNRDSQYWLEDGKYLKITNIEVGYTLPDAWVSKVRISSLRVYAGAQNLLTFTDYSGFDPDFNNDGLFNRGTDQGSAANKAFTDYSGGLPNPRTFLCGVKVQF